MNIHRSKTAVRNGSVRWMVIWLGRSGLRVIVVEQQSARRRKSNAKLSQMARSRTTLRAARRRGCLSSKGTNAWHYSTLDVYIDLVSHSWSFCCLIWIVKFQRYPHSLVYTSSKWLVPCGLFWTTTVLYSMCIADTTHCSFVISYHRYEGLKEEGKLTKFMEKKRKKNAAKDHRWLPAKRQDRG